MNVLAYASDEAPQKVMSTGSGALAPSREVPPEFYSPFKQRLLKEIQKSDYWAFSYDLSTTFEVAEKGMDSFNELLAFPGEYLEILKYLQESSAQLFASAGMKKSGESPSSNQTDQ